MEYVKVQFAQAGIAYQVVDRGFVKYYINDAGTILFESPPPGDKCRVIEPDATPTSAMTTTVATKQSADSVNYDWKRQGDRRSGMQRRLNDQSRDSKIAELEAAPGSGTGK